MSLSGRIKNALVIWHRRDYLAALKEQYLRIIDEEKLISL